MESEIKGRSLAEKIRLFLLFLLYLYLFLLSIQLMGGSFKLFGKGFAETLLRTTSDPISGLFIGLLATALTQSSSTTTSIVVGLVAGGGLTLPNAIPIVMGANMGTTVTNTIVSLGHIGRKDEFRRAFSASVVHDVFNFLSILILFPLQYYTGYLEKISLYFEEILMQLGGVSFGSPLKAVTSPVAHMVENWVGPHAWVMLILALVLLFLSLKNMVKYMKALIMERAEVIFEKTIFRTSFHGLAFGIMLTSLVQSSSVTTSLIVPLAGAGLIGLNRVFPYTMGANIGTTVTAIMASLATGDPTAVAVAMSHLMFNVCGIMIFWWIQFVPINIANRIASLTARNRGYALFYIFLIFFVLPIAVIYLMR